MAAMNFPNNPVSGATYTYEDYNYTFDGVKWTSVVARQDEIVSAAIAAALTERDDARYPIGSVLMRMDSINPGVEYPGTWGLISGDASLTFGDGSAQDGVAGGDNDPLVPLSSHTHAATQGAHTHTMNHDHGSVNTNTTGNHTHNLELYKITNPSTNTDNNYSTEGDIRDSQHYSGNTASKAWSADTTYSRVGAAGNHSHSVNLPNFVGTTGGAVPGISVSTSGDVSPQLDVRGARISINIWKRTA